MTQVDLALRPAVGVSVGEVVSSLVAVGVRLWTAAGGRDLAVSQVIVYDSHGPEHSGGGAILLVPGLTVAEVSDHLLADASERGWTALALKAHDADPGTIAALVAAADAAGVALLGVPDDLDWLSLGLAMTSAVARTIGPVPGSSTFGDLFALANALAASVGGAVAIEDFQQRILAHSNIAGHVIDAGRREGILGRRVPDTESNIEQYRVVYRTVDPVRFAADPPALPRVAIAIRAGSEVLGSIWVVDSGTLSPDLDDAIRAAADVAAMHLLREQRAHDTATQGRYQAVTELLEGTADPTVTADFLGLDPRGPYAVLAIGPTAQTSGVSALFRVVNLAALHAESQLGRSCAALIDGAAHVLVSGKQVGDPAEVARLAAHVVDVVRNSLRLDVVIGMGPAADALGAVPASAEEARRVLALLRRDPQLGPVASTTHVGDQLALATLEHLAGNEPRALSGTAAAIRDHDAATGSELQLLLRTWFESGRDVRATGSALSMHPNTVRYRLRKASALFGLDYADPDQMLLLWLTLRLTGAPQATGGTRGLHLS